MAKAKQARVFTFFLAETVGTGCFKKKKRRKAFTVMHYRFVNDIKKLLSKQLQKFSFIPGVRNQLLMLVKILLELSITFFGAAVILSPIHLHRNLVRMCFFTHSIAAIFFNQG